MIQETPAVVPPPQVAIVGSNPIVLHLESHTPYTEQPNTGDYAALALAMLVHRRRRSR